jgi:hypothetical protein
MPWNRPAYYALLGGQPLALPEAGHAGLQEAEVDLRQVAKAAT